MSGNGVQQERQRLAGAPAERERRPGLRAISAAVAGVAAPIVARRGGVLLARLRAQWSAVVGAELAAAAWPQALGRDGALKLRVAPGFGLELQHRAPLVIERINLFCGRPAVARLIFVQGPLPLAASPPRPVTASLAAADAEAIDDRVRDVADPELREALAGLGRLVLAKAPRSG